MRVSCLVNGAHAFQLRFIIRATLLHGRVLPEYDVRLSVRPSGVTLMDCDQISWATRNFITLLISPVSQSSHAKLLRSSTRGTSSNLGLNKVGRLAFFNRYVAVSQKRWEIGQRLLLITNRKSNKPFQMTWKSSTLDDLERSLRTLLYQSCVSRSSPKAIYSYSAGIKNRRVNIDQQNMWSCAWRGCACLAHVTRLVYELRVQIAYSRPTSTASVDRISMWGPKLPLSSPSLFTLFFSSLLQLFSPSFPPPCRAP